MRRTDYIQVFISTLLFFLILMSCGTNDSGKLVTEKATGQIDFTPILGRWDVTVYDPQGVYPSWFEIEEKDRKLSGGFVGRGGSARPIQYIHYDGEQLHISLPPQYEKPVEDLLFIGHVTDNKIDGKTKSEAGEIVRFRAVRMPSLESDVKPEWGEPINLLEENDLANWKARDPNRPNGWQVANYVLINKPPSVDLVTNEKFNDFKLHIEFKIPPGNNSGVYLRGRYEVQVTDNYGQEPHSRKCGGIYGFITPTEMAVKPAGEWNTYDIAFIGRRVTVILNGTTVIDNVEIPGITGGAIDSREAEPGPIMLQGDHGAIQYRNIILIPAK